MNNFFTIFASFLILTLQSFACDIHGQSGLLPKNALHIPKHSFFANDMTEEKFNAIINRAAAVYTPIAQEKGGVFTVVGFWDDDTVNAYALQSGDKWIVNMYGGLARHPLVTDDALMLVVCHETGHHLGGAPKIIDYVRGPIWCTNEGQADYFGTLKCMRRVIQNDDNSSIVSKMNVDNEVIKKCQQVYKSSNEVAICERVAMASKSLGLLFASLDESNPKIAFNTPDRKVVKETDDEHPAAQCRLDTLFNGSLCDKSFTEEVSDKDPIPGTCIKKDGYTNGVRPLCWYKPGTSE